VIDSVKHGRSPLLLTERNDHLNRLEQLLASEVPHLVVLRAGIGKKQRKAVGDRLAAIPAGEGRVILATGKHVGEGFDDQRLDTLFLTLPVSWRGTVAQYAGRLHRLYDGKREVRIYDYADVNVPMLGRMFDRRCRGYEAIGYTVLLPASAIPGWPADVTLPSDPMWKRDYSGSVRRLVLDGVGSPLANLFVCAARPVSPDADGLARARSATEAFLYRRLETSARIWTPSSMRSCAPRVVGAVRLPYPSLSFDVRDAIAMPTSTRPSVVVLAGPNGAGKSTVAPTLLHAALAVSEFVDADVIAGGLSAFDPESVAFAAGRVMLARLRDLSKRRQGTT
jgi:hypothetical protein